MRWWKSFFVATLLVAAGCGSSSESTVSVDADRPSSFEELEFSSPIGEFLGFDFAREDAETEFAEMEREAGRKTAQCMLEEGFEYTPIDTGSIVSFGPGSDDLPYYSEEWVAKYGFGVSTQRFPQSMVGPDLVGMPDPPFSEGPSRLDDPNQAYVESLSEAEREVYYATLYGEGPDFGPDADEADFESYVPSGCMNSSFEEIFSGGSQMRFYETFGSDIEALYERAEADPRVVRYRNRVSDCVGEAGFVWGPDDRPYERFEADLGQMGPGGFGSVEMRLSESEFDEMSESERDEFLRVVNVLSDEDKAKLAEIQAEEIELAQVVVGCDGGELNEQFFLSAIRAEYEQAFLDENADRLEEFRPAE